MAFSYDVFQVIIFVFLLGLGSEIALYLWCYRSSSFRTINESIVRQSRKADAMKGAPQYAMKQNKSKKMERFEGTLKREATKELAVLKVKQSLVSGLGAVGMYFILARLYSNQVVAKLPFEPHWLLAKVAHRGLKFPEANDCAVTFIYVLCQTGIRMNLQQFLMWGPSRKMQAMSSWQQVASEEK